MKEFKNALAEASIKFIQKKEAVDKAIDKQENVYIFIALLSQPIQEVINVNKDELDNKEHNEEVEFDKYIEGVI